MANIVLPREHGTWAMLIIPVLLGTFLTQFTWLHLFFYPGLVFLIFIFHSPA